MHWILLEVDCETEQCISYDSLPYTALDEGIKDHILNTCKSLFPRTKSQFAYHIVATEHQAERSNDCAICPFTNIWRVATRNQERKFSDTDRKMIQKQWLPALVLSHPAARATRRVHRIQSNIRTPHHGENILDPTAHVRDAGRRFEMIAGL